MIRTKENNALKVLDTNDYYPFGMNLVAAQKPKFAPKSGWENYKYNGKELQETGMYDYGARFYMGDAVIWGQHDPLSEKYYESTPYAYVLGNPISNYDPDGMQVENDYKLLKNGEVKLIKETTDKSDTLYATDNKGNVDTSKSVTVAKASAESGSVISELSNNKIDGGNSFSNGVSYGTTTNANDAFNVYTFAAKNSDVEWGMSGFYNNKSWSFSLYTGGEPSLSPNSSVLPNFSALQFSIHSHKNRNSPSEHDLYSDDFDAAASKNSAYSRATGNRSTNNYPFDFMLYAPNKGAMNLWKYWAIPTTKNGKSVFGGGSKNMGPVKSLNLKTLGL